jgi:hypothetical protein
LKSECKGVQGFQGLRSGVGLNGNLGVEGIEIWSGKSNVK